MPKALASIQDASTDDLWMEVRIAMIRLDPTSLRVLGKMDRKREFWYLRELLRELHSRGVQGKML